MESTQHPLPNANMCEPWPSAGSADVPATSARSHSSKSATLSRSYSTYSEAMESVSLDDPLKIPSAIGERGADCADPGDAGSCWVLSGDGFEVQPKSKSVRHLDDRGEAWVAVGG